MAKDPTTKPYSSETIDVHNRPPKYWDFNRPVKNTAPARRTSRVKVRFHDRCGTMFPNLKAYRDHLPCTAPLK